MEPEDGKAPAAKDLTQCFVCKRSFLPQVLVRHVKICEKLSAKNRRVFDSSRQRRQGSDMPKLKHVRQKVEHPKKPSHWRQKHEDFINTIRAAKALSQVIKDGGPLPPPPPPTYNPDYIQCNFCQRRFNEVAAVRHIKFCRDQAARIANKNKTGSIKKSPARSQYKPPPPPPPPHPPPPPTVKKAIESTVAINSSSSSRLPLRSGLGQTTGTTSSKTSSGGTVRINLSSHTRPPSGVGGRSRAIGSTSGSVRDAQSGITLNRRKTDTYKARDDVNAVGDGGTKAGFCHVCGTKDPVERAKFCCECGVRKMCI